MRSLRVNPRGFSLLCRISLATIVLNVATGAAVRLSGSGLGCPDWPTCAHRRLTPPASVHAIVEFGNRMVVLVLVVSCAATAVASFLRRPARRDLRWLAGGLVLGVVAEAVFGAVVVYTKLNAYVVMAHFMVGMALLATSVVLCLRATHGPGRGTVAVRPAALHLTRAYLVLLAIAVTAGTATTGAGPHAGGVGAKRVDIGLAAMSRIHAETVWVTAIVLLVILVVLWRSDAPRGIQDAGRILLAVMVVQGMVGYTQYFTHLPSLLVGIHVVGATAVIAAAVWFHHGLSDHRPETPTDTAPLTAPVGATAPPGSHEPVRAPA